VPDRKYLLNGTKNEVSKAYLQTIIETAKVFNPTADVKIIEEDAKNMVQFEAKLAKVS